MKILSNLFIERIGIFNTVSIGDFKRFSLKPMKSDFVKLEEKTQKKVISNENYLPSVLPSIQNEDGVKYDQIFCVFDRDNESSTLLVIFKKKLKFVSDKLDDFLENT